jgi:prepilin-type N-terminal cleavage/methylation domain-containing protein
VAYGTGSSLAQVTLQTALTLGGTTPAARLPAPTPPASRRRASVSGSVASTVVARTTYTVTTASRLHVVRRPHRPRRARHPLVVAEGSQCLSRATAEAPPGAGVRRPAADDGFTVIEMTVVMVVFGLAMAMVYAALMAMMGLTRNLQTTSDATSETRIALAEIDRQVRSGNVLFSPAQETMSGACADTATKSGTCMRVYTQANGANRCVQWQVVVDPAGVTAYDAAGASLGRTWLVRMRSWSPEGRPRIYSSWATQARGLQPVTIQAHYPFRLATDTDYGSRLANVSFRAYDARRPANPVVITSSLSGRNTNYGYDGGLCTSLPPG